MALDASLPALVQLAGLLPVHRRRVLVHALAAPLCKGCEATGHTVTCYDYTAWLRALCCVLCFPTYGVASLHLVDGRLGGGEPRVPPAVAQLDEQPLVGRTTEVAFAEVAAVRPRGQLLVLTHAAGLFVFKSESETTSRESELIVDLTSSIPATCAEIPPIHPIQRITPKSGGSFTSTIDPTSSSPSSASSPAASPLSGGLSGEGGPWTPLVCCGRSVAFRDVGLWGLGGRTGAGGSGLRVGFGGGSGGGLSGCLEGGIRATFGAEGGGDKGPGRVPGGGTGFRMDLGICGRGL